MIWYTRMRGAQAPDQGLERSKAGIFKPGHQCKLLQDGCPSYSLGAAEKSTLSKPSTNRPMKCEHCTLVLPSYSMAQHYSMKHSATAMSETLQTAVALGKHEREHVLKLLKKRKLTAADNVCPRESCCPKKKGKAKA